MGRVRQRWGLVAAIAVTALGAVPAAAPAATLVDATLSNPFNGAASHAGRVQRDNVASTCAAPKTGPATLLAPGNSYRYRLHTFASRLVDPVCVNVALTSTCDEIFSVAYAPAFDPAAPADRVADMGTSPPGGSAYAFTVAGGSTFAIVNSETVVGSSCTSYRLVVTTAEPWAQARPVVQGTAAVGATLTATDGTWDGTPALARQWRRCDRAGTACTDIAGATGATYAVQPADLGATVRFRVTATEGGRSSASESAPLDAYVPFASRPAEAIGPGDRGQLGMFVRGSVTGRCGAASAPPTVLQPAATFLYDAFGVTSLLNEEVCLVARTAPGCVEGVTLAIHAPAYVPGAITTSYRAHDGAPAIGAAATGTLLAAGGQADVVATAGQAGAGCASYALTLGADGAFATARPVVTGTPAVGAPVGATSGTWSGSPALSAAWLRCDAAGAGCVPIAGATGLTYLPTTADVGATLRVRVSATLGRTLSSDSAPTAPVPAPPPPPAPPVPGPAPPVPSARDTRPPGVRVTAVRTSLRAIRRSGSLPVAVTCDERCRLTPSAQVTTALGRRLGGRTIARGTARTLAANRRTTVRLALTRRARAGLRRRSTLRTTVRVVAADAAGNRRTVTRALIVRAR